MLKMCFDGSGKTDDSASRIITLAGFAAEDQAWEFFDHHWVLKKQGVGHLHMADLFRGNSPYAGRGERDIEHLIQELSLVPSNVAQDFRIQGARFSIDATAHRKWAEVSNACSIPENLALGAFHRLFQWYAESPKAILDPIVVLYDRGEPYLNKMMQRWHRRFSSDKERPWWHLISSIEQVDSTKVCWCASGRYARVVLQSPVD